MDKYKPNFMFLCKVLVGTTCIGHQNMIIPSNGTDTAVSPDGQVYVKFDDDTFYPAYLIRFN
jgi:hypothetical protein